jgi:uncharacterized protein YkwD
MRSGNIFGILLFGASLFALAPAAAHAGEFDEQILSELNFARAHPREYATRMLSEPVSDWEQRLSKSGCATDAIAYAEAVEFLMRQDPLPPLKPDDLLAAAALEHVSEQGPSGETGHSGSGGERFSDRLRRHGVRAELAAENIAYGPPTPSDVVRELIIDSGVPSRGHRRNIFHPAMAAAGVNCGPHREYATMCVIDFASAPIQADGWRQAELSPKGRGGSFFRLLLAR